MSLVMFLQGFVCRKLEGLTSDQYLRVVSLQEKSNEDGTQCV